MGYESTEQFISAVPAYYCIAFFKYSKRRSYCDCGVDAVRAIVHWARDVPKWLPAGRLPSGYQQEESDQKWMACRFNQVLWQLLT